MRWIVWILCVHRFWRNRGVCPPNGTCEKCWMRWRRRRSISKSVIGQIDTAGMAANGAPADVHLAMEYGADRAEVSAEFDRCAIQTAGAPAAALDAYFRMQAMESTLGSVFEGVRKYQNPALADLLQGVVNEKQQQSRSIAPIHSGFSCTERAGIQGSGQGSATLPGIRCCSSRAQRRKGNEIDRDCHLRLQHLQRAIDGYLRVLHQDTCRNHRCERCKRCSDCCECEVPLGRFEPEPAPEPEPEPAPAPIAAESEAAPAAVVVEPAPPEASEEPDLNIPVVAMLDQLVVEPVREEAPPPVVGQEEGVGTEAGHEPLMNRGEHESGEDTSEE